MTIISSSLDEESLKLLDDIQSNYGLKNKSQALRLAISMASDTMHAESPDEGNVEGVLVIVRRNHDDPWMIRIQARYQGCIVTQMHSHLKDSKCLEVMVLSCDAETLSEFMRDIRSENKADYVKFVKG
ncbi:MAG: CopG family transcriptional regulator [Candidatus Methanomethylophilaceae archaeon]|nr:CopG family transcriptional regulator [Candidatus Methanomethylophilaceae archaeon]